MNRWLIIFVALFSSGPSPVASVVTSDRDVCFSPCINLRSVEGASAASLLRLHASSSLSGSTMSSRKLHVLPLSPRKVRDECSSIVDSPPCCFFDLCFLLFLRLRRSMSLCDFDSSSSEIAGGDPTTVDDVKLARLNAAGLKDVLLVLLCDLLFLFFFFFFSALLSSGVPNQVGSLSTMLGVLRPSVAMSML